MLVFSWFESITLLFAANELHVFMFCSVFFSVCATILLFVFCVCVVTLYSFIPTTVFATIPSCIDRGLVGHSSGENSGGFIVMYVCTSFLWAHFQSLSFYFEILLSMHFLVLFTSETRERHFKCCRMGEKCGHQWWWTRCYTAKRRRHSCRRCRRCHRCAMTKRSRSLTIRA